MAAGGQLTLAEWRKLKPDEAARHVHARAAELRPGQREAVFAWLADEAALANELAAGRRRGGPLAGIPCVVKDVFDAEGLPTKAGSVFLDKERPLPEADGALVAKVRSLGAALAGKTHLHEFAYGITGENPHYGDVEHPRWPGRTSGGSSSGSAAAVAAGVVPLAFGTDTAGSIRVPAAFCGLFGFRMTPHHPWIADAFPLAPSFDTAGWFTGNAADMREVLAALLGPRAKPATALRGAWLAFGDVEPALAAAQAEFAGKLGAPLDGDLAESARTAFAEAPGAFNALRAPEAYRIHVRRVQAHGADYDPLVLARVLAGKDVTDEAVEAGKLAMARIADAFNAIWDRYDFLVLPATPCAAPTKAGCTQATRDRIFRLTTPVSVAGLPALTLPVESGDGFTTGVQVVAPHADSPAFAAVLEALS